MALDDRYRWKVQDGVKDALDRPAAIGVGIDNGRVIMDTRGWVGMTDTAAEQLTYKLLVAIETIRQQRAQR